MKIVIADIPDEGLIVDMEEMLTSEDVTLSSPAVSRLSLNKVGKEVIVSGMLKAEMELQCSRCLADFRQNLDIPVNVVYHPLEDAGDERHALKDDELNMEFYKGEELDLLELLTEQIILSKPMKPLCSDRCKGICPQCGKDLNTGRCGCSTKEIDPRLEVLKNFFEK